MDEENCPEVPSVVVPGFPPCGATTIPDFQRINIGSRLLTPPPPSPSYRPNSVAVVRLDQDPCLFVRACKKEYSLKMAPKQQMKIANEKAQKNILMRGNVPKSTVSGTLACWLHSDLDRTPPAGLLSA